MSENYPLPDTITITPWGTQEEKSFVRVRDVLDWVALEREAWEDSVEPRGHQLGSSWRAQRDLPSQLESYITAMVEIYGRGDVEGLDELSKQNLMQHFGGLKTTMDQYTSGSFISSHHPYFSYALALNETDPDAGAVLLLSCLSHAPQVMAQIESPLASIARIGPGHTYLDKAKRKTIASLKSELSTLKKRASKDATELQAIIDQYQAQTYETSETHQTWVKTRQEDWDKITDDVNEEWAELKRVYDEKLALLAPTEYWRDRSKAHKANAIKFAIAFSLVLIVSIALFVMLGIGQLREPGTQSVVLAILPVLVPAFAGIWVLRIIGRLLSENLLISQDALERETMVKTFLSLMRDETTGKQVITDEDRKIILHALFRPSALTATDDSPPMHWVQMLKPKP